MPTLDGRAKAYLLLTAFTVIAAAPFAYLEAYTFFWKAEGTPPPRPDATAILALRRADLGAVPAPWPWPREFWVPILRRLAEAEPARVLLYADLDLDEPAGPADAEFIAALRGFREAHYLGRGPGSAGTRAAPKVSPRIAAGFTSVTPLEMTFDRRGAASGFRVPAEGAGLIRKAWPATASDSAPAPGEVLRAPAEWIRGLPRVGLRPLLKAGPPPDLLRGKTVVVGPTSTILHDIYDGPLGPVTGAELLAATWRGVEAGRRIRVPPWAGVFAALLVMAAALFAAGRARRPGPVVAVALGLGLVWAFGARAAYHWWGLDLPLLRPLVLIAALATTELLGQRSTPDTALQLSNPHVEAEAQALFHEAVGWMGRGETARAARQLAAVASLETRLRAKAEHRLVLCLLGGDQGDVAALLTQTLDFPKLDGAELEGLAGELAARGFKAEARRVYEELSRLEPDRPGLTERLAELRHELSDFSERDMVEAVARRVLDRRFEDVRLHGSGGGGFLFRVCDRRRGGEEVALKILSPLRVNDPAWVARFAGEAKDLLALRHPNLIAVYEYFDANLPHYTMEFFAGESLETRAGTPTPWREAIGWVAQAARGLGAAHAAGLIHRDVKPGNLLRGPTGVIKVIDFGVAKRGEAAAEEGAALGTPLYMAPEQLSQGEVSPATDVYGLGCTFYELLTGRPPFETPQARLLGDAPGLPDGVAPGSVAVLVARMLAREPENRPGSMGELEREIGGVLDGV